jgi:hypothetical protein
VLGWQFWSGGVTNYNTRVRSEQLINRKNITYLIKQFTKKQKKGKRKNYTKRCVKEGYMDWVNA